MIRRATASLACVAALMAPAVAQRRHAETAAVVNAGSEQALRIGRVTVSRPFGAQLVDSIRIVGEYRLGGAALWLIEGSGDAACPRRYVIVARRSATDLVASDPFGACGPAGRARVAGADLIVPVATGAAGGPTVRFAYRAGRVRALDAPAAGPVAAALSPSACLPATAVAAEAQAAAVAQFRQSFPDDYARLAAQRPADVDPQVLRTLVTGLSCLASWPSANATVLHDTTRLFASRRWGGAAFAALDAVARDPASDPNVSAAVRAFSAEMSYRAADHEPI